MAQALPPPFNVSPFIRGSRWLALIAGVGYGSFHYNRLAKKEARLREVELKLKAERDVKRAAEKAILNRAEMLMLAKETGMELPAEFDKQLPVK